jgi:predicted NAD/FAD-binding protein
MNIAIIGAGVSGLTCAHYLSPHHNLTLFEKNNYMGGHAHTVEVTIDRTTYALDTGFLVHNTPGYPGFTKLINELGIKTIDSEMSFSVSQKNPDFEYNGHTLLSLFAQKRNLWNPKFYGMLKDILHFNQSMKIFIQEESPMSLETFIEQNGYGHYFKEYYLRPMLAAIWSADPSTVFEFSAIFLGRFFNNHGLLQISGRPLWRTIRGGSREYVQAILKSQPAKIHHDAVADISKKNPYYTIKTASGKTFSFDAVIIATHSDEALALYKDMPDHLKEALQNIPYQKNEVILHTDTSLMPKRKSAWASWNYSLNTRQKTASVTYYLNRLQNLSAPVDFLVTLNQTEAIDPSKILQTFVYDHPVFNQKSLAAQTCIHQHNGQDNFYLCGAYLGNGFHEDGVQSALRVCKQLGIEAR